MNWLDILGGQQQPAQMDNPYQARAAYENAMQDKQRAAGMMNAQYQGGGKLGVLAVLAQALGGRALNARADESVTEALKRQFEIDNQAQQAAFARANAEEDRKRQHDFEKIERKAVADAKARAANRAKTEFDYLPEGERAKAARIKAGLELGAQAPREAPRVTYGQPVEVIGPNGKPVLVRPGSDGSMIPLDGFAPKPAERQMTAADVKLAQADQMREVSLANAASIVEKLEKMTEERVGGPVAASGLNPFTNRLTSAGQAIERYEGLSSMLVDELTRLTRIPGIGAQSDAELRNILKMIPTADKSEATRSELLKQIKAKISSIGSTVGGAPGDIAPKGASGWGIQRID